MITARSSIRGGARTTAITLLTAAIGSSLLFGCSDDSWPTFPGRRGGDNDWELMFSWEQWGDPGFVPVVPDWSPDCSQIAFTLIDNRNYYNPDNSVFLYDLNTTVFSEIENTSPFSGTPKWSPDGEWINYFSSHSSYMSIWIIRPDGTDNTPIFGSHGTPGVFGQDGSWGPDSKYLVFRGHEANPDAELNGFIIADISDLEDIQYRCLMRFDADTYAESSPEWGPGSGDFITYERYLGDFGLNEIAITTSEGEYFDTLIPVMEGPDYTYQVWLFDWSPDCRYLLLYINGTYPNYNGDLWAYELKTGEFTQLTFNDNEYSGFGGASWGSNGKIVFDYVTSEVIEGDHIYDARIYTIDALL